MHATSNSLRLGEHPMPHNLTPDAQDPRIRSRIRQAGCVVPESVMKALSLPYFDACSHPFKLLLTKPHYVFQKI